MRILPGLLVTAFLVLLPVEVQAGDAIAPTFDPPATRVEYYPSGPPDVVPIHYEGSVTVTLQSATPGANIRYAFGSGSSYTDYVYTAPITLHSSSCISAMAHTGTFTGSYSTDSRAAACYTIVAVRPTLTPPPGTYYGSVQLSMTSPTSGAQIRYTDWSGGDPASTSAYRYTAPITITSTRTIKAVTTSSGLLTSGVSEGAYTILPISSEVVFNPTFWPLNGSSGVAPLEITISSSTPDEVIYYTTNGSAPSTSSILYTGPFSLTTPGSVTVKAIATKPGFTSSGVYSATYTVTDLALVVAEPSCSPSPGNYQGSATITLSSATTGASIRYTLDGTAPSVGATVYDAPRTIAESATLRAVAFKDGMITSAETQCSYTVTTAYPTFNPPASTRDGFVSVAISSATPGATIYYTTDGSEPTYTSQVYAAPLSLTQTTTIRAFAHQGSNPNSQVAPATYTITPLLAPAIQFTNSTGRATVTITTQSTAPNAEIRYTTNGTEPTSASTLYAGAFNVYTSTTVRAKAFAAPASPSATTATAVSVTAQAAAVATPTFSPGDWSTGVSPLRVSISTATSGATIYYTTDGSYPTTSSTRYSGAFSLWDVGTKTVRAFATKSGMTDSAVASATYTMTDPLLVVAEPQFEPVERAHLGSVQVRLTSSTSGATIYYSLTGTPSRSSTLYVNPFTLSQTANVRAIAYKDGMAASAVATKLYVVFRDVPGTSEFSNHILRLASLGALAGQDGLFRPEDSLTRAELCKIVVVAAGMSSVSPVTPTYKDVPTSHSLYSYVETATAYGAVSGYGDGSFRPDAPVSRGEAAKIVAKAFSLTTSSQGPSHFTDVGTDNPFFAHIEALYGAGIVSGQGGRFGVDATITRGEMAKLVARAAGM